MRFLWLWACGCAIVCSASPPVKVWVDLRDKGPVSLSGRALEDAPLYPPYLNGLRQAGFTPDVSLKWQNRVSGWIDSLKMADLSRLPGVSRVEILPHHKVPFLRKPRAEVSSDALSKVAADPAFGSFQQVFDTTQASALSAAVTAAGQTPGQGLRIAVIDQNFPLGSAAFTHLWQDSQIVDQWDFDRNLPVTAHDTLAKNPEDGHGAAVLSLLAGQSGALQGLVPAAKYLLYIAQNSDTEYYDEEDWVAAAIERAVDSGAQVINISLSDRFDYEYPPDTGAANPVDYDVPYSDMNGRTRPSSLAALGAARRGVLVSVAIGNEGSARDGGPTVSAPADADSILSVGDHGLESLPLLVFQHGADFRRAHQAGTGGDRTGFHRHGFAFLQGGHGLLRNAHRGSHAGDGRRESGGHQFLRAGDHRNRGPVAAASSRHAGPDHPPCVDGHGEPDAASRQRRGLRPRARGRCEPHPVLQQRDQGSVRLGARHRARVHALAARTRFFLRPIVGFAGPHDFRPGHPDGSDFRNRSRLQPRRRRVRVENPAAARFLRALILRKSNRRVVRPAQEYI